MSAERGPCKDSHIGIGQGKACSALMVLDRRCCSSRQVGKYHRGLGGAGEAGRAGIKGNGFKSLLSAQEAAARKA